MSLQHDDVDKILQIVDASHFSTLTLQIGDLKVTVRKGAGGAPLDSAATVDGEAKAPSAPESPSSPAAAPAPPSPQIAEGLVAVRAAVVGTFYRRSAPDAPPFVEVGKTVAADDTVALLEAMKLYLSITAGVAGTVEQILVDDATLVEYDQVLMTIRPLPAA